ncbi:MAG TPA: DNA-directed RNA polymerase subunit beta [Sedimentisphaerales bacterium]|nr:DNA-directed RNA polymerase subunit beta [Sedimentisphaerales bacterium]
MVLQKVRDFGKVRDVVDVPDLVAIQRTSYESFLQRDVAPTKRKCVGLEGLFREIFPIQNYDKTMYLEYLYYELEDPRYTPHECRQLRLTYGYPLKVCCRLRSKDDEDLAEQSIYLGEIPVMIGGGEFIINGAERVIVNQLHRSPGVDFLIESKEGDRVLHGGRVIPERGSWIEISVTHKDILVVKIDQSSKIPATIFLRAIDRAYSTTEDILRAFYPTKTVPAAKLTPSMWAVGPIVDTETGEIIVKAGRLIGDKVSLIQSARVSSHAPLRMSLTEAQKWLETDEGRRWVEQNQKALREMYIVAGGIRTGGFVFKCVVTEQQGVVLKDKGAERQLSALETKLALEYPAGKDKMCPRFNDEDGLLKKDQLDAAWKSNPMLDELFRECKKAIESSSGWIEVRNLDEYKGVTNEQGIYFFKSLKTGRVNDGYVGKAGSEKSTNPRAQGLGNRLRIHFKATFKSGTHKRIGDCGDNLLKTWALTELVEHGISVAGDNRIEVIEQAGDTLVLNTLAEDDCQSHEQALLKFYVRLRPGNPPNEEKARAFFAEKFFDSNRYRLGRVGRFRLNRKLNLTVDENEMTLRPEDFLNTMKYIIALRNNEGMVDDIDHLGNRRLRTIDELAGDEIRKGLLKLRKTVQERMSIRRDTEEPMRIADLVNTKSVSSSINFFFGRGELSQVVDQTNALSQLTHERRLSALGPGGLNRRRAGFEVRDVHISHYGRICPIETPEGTNIGLISSLAIFATVDEYGFLLTPYRKVEKGKATDKVDYLRADDDMKAVIAAPAAFDQQTGKIKQGVVLAMKGGELAQVSSEEVNYVDVSPKQTVGVSASLIPFLEHDDANRALMGSNMQRQAVPLLKTEALLVGTGMEEVVGRNSSMVVRAKRAGAVTTVDAQHIVINHTDEYKLEKFVGLNERTCLNQKPIVKLGQKVEKGQIIADGGGTADGVLALGKNVLVGFVSFDGFNFEDAIVVSEKLIKNDSFTSIHIDEFTAEVRETRLGTEEFTRDIPNVGERALRNLDEHGVIREGTRVCPGDILVGKVVPKSKTELTPEEKLLHAIFGRAGEDVKNDSLELPSGYEGVVIKTELFTKRGVGGEEQKKTLKAEMRQYEDQMKSKECFVFRQMIEAIRKKFDVTIVDPSTRQKVGESSDDEVIYEQVENFDIKWVKPASVRENVQKIVDKFWINITEIQEEKKRRIERLKHGDELPSGVLEMVKVYVATKRTLSVGDKIAGRHGNKGVIAKIMPEEDMPFLEDGTSLDILLNPLGVPSRMNVGQILETHLGWVAKVLGFQAISPVFDGATEEDIRKLTAEANELMSRRKAELEANRQVPPVDEFFVNTPTSLKTQLCDGRTGEPFDQGATIGYIYIMKLHHLVDDKIHARATGPYSLITQQPLGGKTRTGGQRFGEMEVWALEGYGAAYTLQEMLTVKSDDIEGRTKIYESMVKGQNSLEAGTPLSFDVLCNELRGLGLNIQLEKKRLGGTVL